MVKTYLFHTSLYLFTINHLLQNTAVLDEDIKEVKGGLNELNDILKSTQTKINKLKVSGKDIY